MNTVLVSPKKIIEQVAQAIPPNCKRNIIIVGSLAVGYELLPDDYQHQVRTKDIDSVVSPRIEAVKRSQQIVQELLSAGWTHKNDGGYGSPGNASTPTEDLPVIRLFPPQQKDWWIEFLTEPESNKQEGRRFQRVPLDTGDYALPSFSFTSLAVYNAELCEFGIYIARPEMMALANMLEHQTIKDDPIREHTFRNREIKRSNKDLGRALAIAWLVDEGAIEAWPSIWREGLEYCFPENWRSLAKTAGNGIRELIMRAEDLEEATYTCNNGLLSGRDVDSQKLEYTGERMLLFAVEPLANMAT
jgi:hypothetical protein